MKKNKKETKVNTILQEEVSINHVYVCVCGITSIEREFKVKVTKEWESTM